MTSNLTDLSLEKTRAMMPLKKVPRNPQSVNQMPEKTKRPTEKSGDSATIQGFSTEDELFIICMSVLKGDSDLSEKKQQDPTEADKDDARLSFSLPRTRTR